VIRAEGKTHRSRVIQVTVANGRSYGGGMTIHEDASIDDGALDVLLILPGPLWRYVLSALSFRRGVYSKRAPMVAAKATRFEIATTRRKAVATDGEISTFTPAAFDMLPKALEVFVPDEPAER
jgi:diacylglycerol kinase family enzyme